MAFYCRTFDWNKKFRANSTFNPKNKDVIIETYLGYIEEKLLDIDIPTDNFNNLSKGERDALYSLKYDNTMVVKGADKGSGVVVWGREDYLKEVHNHISEYFFNKYPKFARFYLFINGYMMFLVDQ